MPLVNSVNHSLLYMTPHAAKRQIRPAGSTDAKQLSEAACINWAAVARRHGVSRSALCLTLHGRRGSPRMRAIVAGALGIPLARLWPHSPNGGR